MDNFLNYTILYRLSNNLILHTLILLSPPPPHSHSHSLPFSLLLILHSYSLLILLISNYNSLSLSLSPPANITYFINSLQAPYFKLHFCGKGFALFQIIMFCIPVFVHRIAKHTQECFCQNCSESQDTK